MAEWLASSDYRIEMSWVRIPVSLGVMGSDGICKYLSFLSASFYVSKRGAY